MSRAPEPMSFWTGVNSWLHPSMISKQQFAWGENIINRGGIIQTRPGYGLLAGIKGKRLQGFTVFTPKRSTARLVAAVDGSIYFAKYPGFNFVKLTGLQFDPEAPFIEMEVALRSAEHRKDGTIRLIDPTPTLMIQDNISRCGYWDGSTAEHLIREEGGTPTGLWMVWAFSRLWMISGTQVLASDLGDPISFTETLYLAERSNFELPGIGTGIKKASDEVGIIATTSTSVTALKGFILDRNQWQLTPNFQKEIVPDIGCVAGRSLVNQYGQTYWLSDRGLISLDAALFAQRSSRLVTLDSAMQRSKRNLSPILSGAAFAAYNDFLLMSVPSGSKYNAHTWVADRAPMEDQGNDSAFLGVWTGIRPVQWAQGYIGGRKRLLCASFDATQRGDTNIHIWEAFRPDREDAGHGIKCQFETMMVTSTDEVRFKFATIEACEILGTVDVEVFVGGMGGPWISIGTMRIEADKGSLGGPFQEILEKDSILEAYKPQSRTLTTQEFVAQGFDCHPELKQHGKGKGFQLLFEWTGRFGIREINPRFDTEAVQQNKGKCEKPEDGPNAVNEQGTNITE